MIENVIIGILSYFIGAIPFSVILVKLLHNKDLIIEGSGNAGALNSYEVSGNKLTGISVMLLDIFKGAFIVLIYHYFFNGNFSYLLIASIWVVLGHNLSIFLKFKGGRGLATAAGLFILINPFLLITWIVMWAAGYNIIKKNVHVASSIALIGSSILAFSTKDEMLAIFDFLHIGNYFSVKILFTVIAIIILIKHIKPLQELFKKEE